MFPLVVQKAKNQVSDQQHSHTDILADIRARMTQLDEKPADWFRVWFAMKYIAEHGKCLPADTPVERLQMLWSLLTEDVSQ